MKNENGQYEDDKLNSTEDKCDNCGDTDAEQYWDFEDGSILCEKCNTKVGEEWDNKITKTNNSKKIRCDACDRDFGNSEALESHNNSKHKNTRHTTSKKISGKTIAIISALFVVALIVVSFSIFGHATSSVSNVDANVVASQDGVQTATLRVSGSKYILEPSTFKKDVPVKIIANINSMPGCSKAVTIPAFGIFKYVDNKDNIIAFTPTKIGTFKIACSMSMYTGTFTVE